MKTYAIYSLINYKKTKEADFDTYKYEFSISDVVKILETDKYYNFRILKNENYIFFGDLDGFKKPFDDFINIIIIFLKNNYDLVIDEEDIKYTKNNRKEGSYHYSIPKYWASVSKIKEIHQNLRKQYPDIFKYVDEKKTQNCIDTTIYSNHWFRCPNQSKGDPDLKVNNQHIIIKGVMQDFIVSHIPEESININEKKYKHDMRVKKTTITSVIQPINIKTVVDKIAEELDLLNVLSTTEYYKKIFNECYKQERFDSYEHWIAVGMAIKNTFDEDGFGLFNFFSLKGNNYGGEAATLTKYKSFNKKDDKGYSVATLNYYAIEDNKDKFKEIAGKNTLDLAPTDICKIIKMIAGHKFIYKRSENYTLYCFDQGKWVRDDVPMKKFISGELYDFLKKMLTEVYWHSRDFQLLKKKLDKLKTLPFKSELIGTYKEYGVNDSVKFDDKWWLLGFENKVYDLKEGKMRDYQYDDYVVTTVGYDWRDPTDEEITTLDNIINTVMPVKEEKDAYLEILSTGMDGQCLEKFIVFNGSGGNGKGMMDDLVLVAMGNYAMIGNNGILFERSKTGTNPEKANIHKKRLVIFREPSEKSKFEVSVVKELTGGGTFSARTHHEKTTQKELSQTTIVECNEKPLFSEEPGDALIRRVVDIMFRSKFKENPNDIDDSKNIYLANSYYKTTEFQNKHKYALLSILMKYYKNFIKNNCSLCLPESIKKRTQLYLELSCDIVQWFKDNYVETSNVKEYVQFSDIFDKFKNDEFYYALPKTDRKKYNKTYIYDYLENNVFFRKYYAERYGNIRHLLKGWKEKNNIDEDSKNEDKIIPEENVKS